MWWRTAARRGAAWALAALGCGAPARADVITGADWVVRFNRPDQTTTFAGIGTNEFDIRNGLLERLSALASNDVGYLATYTLSGAYAENGAAGPLLAAVSNALARGAKVGFVVGGGVDLETNFWPGCSLNALAARPGNALELVRAPATGIMHDKLAIFDYRATGEKWVVSGSWNFTAAASSQQWNIMTEIRNGALAAAFTNELRQMLNGYFHSHPAKPRIPHDNALFRTVAGPADGWVRFAPYPSGKADGDNAQMQITNRIGQARQLICFALNKQTRAVVTDRLIAACDRGVVVHGVIPVSDRADAGDASHAQYLRMLDPANYATTNRIHLHEAFYKCTSATQFDSGTPDLVHCKYMVIDPFGAEPWVVHGSANWTLTALATTNTPASNDENVLFIADGGLARAFLSQFAAMTGVELVAPPSSGVRLAIASGGPGDAPVLRFAVPAGADCTLVGTTNLATWAPVWALPLAAGTNEIVATNLHPRLFFRIADAAGSRRVAETPRPDIRPAPVSAPPAGPQPLTNGSALAVSLTLSNLTAVGEGGLEYVLGAEVRNDTGMEISQAGWSIVPAAGGSAGFAGIFAEDGTSLTLVPVAADGGRAFDVAYTVVAGADAAAVTNSAVCRLTVLNPRLVDFETLGSFSYPTNYVLVGERVDYVGLATNLNGMDWKFFNVRRSETNALGAFSARMRHGSSSLPGILESCGDFAGVGSISVNYALYSSTGFVSFVVETREPESTEWVVAGSAVRVEAGGHISNQLHTVDVNRPGPVQVRVRTTGGYGRVVNIDNLTVRPHGELVPHLVVSGAPAAAVGREYVLEFNVANGAGAPRAWSDFGVAAADGGAAPPLAAAGGGLRLAFTPALADAGRVFTATGTVAIYGGQYVYATSRTFVVAAAPEFDLHNASTNGNTVLYTNQILDVWTTNVTVDGVACTNSHLYQAQWTARPPFATNTLDQYNRYRIGAGLTAADVGNHDLSMTITDRSNGLATTHTLHFLVLDREDKDPRHLDFEEFAATNGAAQTVRLSGADWTVSHVCAGWSDLDARVGTTAARCLSPASEEPAVLESVSNFPGVGYVEFSCAGYGGASGGEVQVRVRTNGTDFVAVGLAVPASGELTRHRVYVGAHPDVSATVRLEVRGAAGTGVDLDEVWIGGYRPEERVAVEGALRIAAGAGFDLRFVVTNLEAGVSPGELAVLRAGWDVTQYEAGEEPVPLYSLQTVDEIGGTRDDLLVAVWLSSGFRLATNAVLEVDPYVRAHISGFGRSNLTLLAMAGWSNVVFAVTNLNDAALSANWIWSVTNIHAADGPGEIPLPGPGDPPGLEHEVLFYGVRTP